MNFLSICGGLFILFITTYFYTQNDKENSKSPIKRPTGKTGA